MRAGLCTSRLEPVLTRLCTWQKKLKAAAEEEQAKKRRLLKELNEDIKNRSRSLLGLASAGEGTQAAQGSKDEVVSGRVTYLLPARAPAKAESGQVQVETERAAARASSQARPSAPVVRKVGRRFQTTEHLPESPSPAHRSSADAALGDAASVALAAPSAASSHEPGSPVDVKPQRAGSPDRLFQSQPAFASPGRLFAGNSRQQDTAGQPSGPRTRRLECLMVGGRVAPALLLLRPVAQALHPQLLALRVE